MTWVRVRVDEFLVISVKNLVFHLVYICASQVAQLALVQKLRTPRGVMAGPQYCN